MTSLFENRESSTPASPDKKNFKEAKVATVEDVVEEVLRVPKLDVVVEI